MKKAQNNASGNNWDVYNKSNILHALWIPTYPDDFIDFSNWEMPDSIFSKLLLFAKKLPEHNPKEGFALYCSDYKIPNIKLKEYIIKNGLKWIDVTSDTKGDDIIPGIKGGIAYLKANVRIAKIDVSIYTDIYGFWFFDISTSNEDAANDLLTSLFDKLFSDATLVLTNRQKDLLGDTILNKTLTTEWFDPSTQSYSQPENYIRNFLSHIAVPVTLVDTSMQESLNCDYIKRVYKLSEEDATQVNRELKERLYNIEYLTNLVIDYKDKLPKNSNTSNFCTDLLNLSLQDTLERHAVEGFLREATSSNYFEKIMHSIKAVREGLIEKIVFITINAREPEGLLSEAGRKVYDYWTEDKIERFIEFAISKYPSFRDIDKLLQTAYYHKIGNISIDSIVASGESIDNLASYQYWQNNLENLSENLNSLRNILTLFQNKKNYNELEDLKKQVANQKDSANLSTLFFNASKKDIFGTKGKNYVSLIGVYITYIATIFTLLQNLDLDIEPIFIFSLILLGFYPVTRLMPIFRSFMDILFFDTAEPSDIQLIHYRSRHQIKIAPNTENCDCIADLTQGLLRPGIGDNFTYNVAQLEGAKINTHGYKNIPLISPMLTSHADCSVEVERLDPFKRRVELKYKLSSTYTSGLWRKIKHWWHSVMWFPLPDPHHCTNDLWENYVDILSLYIDCPIRCTTHCPFLSSLNICAQTPGPPPLPSCAQYSYLTFLDKAKHIKYLKNGLLKVYVVYSFNLRDEGLDEVSSSRYLQVYKDSVRIYYSLTLPSFFSLPLKKKVHSIVNQLLYEEFIYPLHSPEKIHWREK